MFNLIPVFVLILSALFVLVLGRVKFNPGRAWLIALISSAIAWLSVVALGILHPGEYLVENWITAYPGSTRFSLGFTSDTWVLGFLLSSMIVIIVLNEAKTLQEHNQLSILATEMILTAVGILAVLASSGMAYLVTWVIIDLVEFGLLSRISKDEAIHRSVTISLLLRMLGNLLMVFVIVMLNRGTDSEELPGLIIILIALLRIGILPIHKNYTNVSTLKRGVGTVLRFIPPITVASFLLFMNPGTYAPAVLVILKIMLSIGCLYGALAWLLAKDELDGRTYWILSIGCLSLIAFLLNISNSISALMILMVVAGLSLFLYSPRLTHPWVYLVFLLLEFLTLPYTPTATLRSLLWGQGFSLISVVTFLSFILLLAGVIKHFLRDENQLVFMETWMRFMYVVALVLILVTPWVAEAIFFDQVTGFSNMGTAIAVTLVIIFMIFGRTIIRSKLVVFKSRMSNTILIAKKGVGAIGKVMNLEWFFQLMQRLLDTGSNVISVSVKVQEGDGGLLWSFLFLVLIASLLINRLTP